MEVLTHAVDEYGLECLDNVDKLAILDDFYHLFAKDCLFVLGKHDVRNFTNIQHIIEILK